MKNIENEGGNLSFFLRGMKGVPQVDNEDNVVYKKSCCKFDAIDWLEDITVPIEQQQRKYVEIRFKNDRKEFFQKDEDLLLKEGDIVAVESALGHDIGIVSLVGQIVTFQMRKKRVDPKNVLFRKVYRKAKSGDMQKWIYSVEQEEITKIKARQIALNLNLQMKINDVEYQGDATKAIFYYTAEERVDFRELIKLLAEFFRIRIEMKQIGTRQEAGKVGGIGSCGREMCCSSWMSSFQTVSTGSARTQRLALNPQKLAGQCGKLKCCLNFEQKMYEEALKKFPAENVQLKTKKGIGVLVKQDVYKETLWFVYKDDSSLFHPMTLENVNKVVKLNEKGRLVDSLESFSIQQEKDLGYNVVGHGDLKRFDKK